MLVFEKRGKPEYPEKNLSEQGREPKTNSKDVCKSWTQGPWTTFVDPVHGPPMWTTPNFLPEFYYIVLKMVTGQTRLPLLFTQLASQSDNTRFRLSAPSKVIFSRNEASSNSMYSRVLFHGQNRTAQMHHAE